MQNDDVMNVVRNLCTGGRMASAAMVGQVMTASPSMMKPILTNLANDGQLVKTEVGGRDFYTPAAD